jgi:hypothetical protein
MTQPVAVTRFANFAAFYQFYLAEHSNRTCRRLHFTGSSLGLVFIAVAIVTAHAAWLIVALLCGYGGAWVGHFYFEKNRPASFKYPLWSFCGDWLMYFDMLRGRLSF